MSVFDEIKAEQERQVKIWCGQSHDDVHTNGDWFLILSSQIGKIAVSMLDNQDSWRTRMIRVAAIAVSAVESHDRRTGRTVGGVV